MVFDYKKKSSGNRRFQSFAGGHRPRQRANYRGALISCSNVIDAINRNSDHCAEGGLSEFLDQTMDDFLNACENTEIADIRKYTKSLIWSSVSTYRVKLDAACLS